MERKESNREIMIKKIYKRLLKSENETWEEFGEDLLSSINGNFVIEEIEDRYVKIVREPQ